MGLKGPIPERKQNLLGHRSSAELAGETVSRAEARDTRWPHANPEWDPVVRDFYYSCRKSGQSEFYQQSDIMLLFLICEDLHYYRSSKQRSAMMASTIYSAMGGLGISEGDRRRMRIELDRPNETDEADEALNAYMAQLGVVQQ